MRKEGRASSVLKFR